MSQKTKLELTWVGKGQRPRLEPRILLADPSKSYHATAKVTDHDIFDNKLIFGDNLLALKALEREYAGEVKCIYIDPPFNTGEMFENYDDGLEHSTWLSQMRDRFEIMKLLLDDGGSIFVHLNDDELDYCKVLLDEVFERRNFVNRITVDARSPSAFSTVNAGVFKSSEYILWYCKDRKKFIENSGRVRRQPDYAYSKWIENIDDSSDKWIIVSLMSAYEKSTPSRSKRPDSILDHFNKFIINNAQHVCRLASISDSGAGEKIIELKRESMKFPSKIFCLKRPDGLDDIYVVDGQQLIFYSKNISIIDNQKCATSLMTNIWTDIAWEGIANEGSVTFRKGKKPEKLIRRCIELATNEGDLVLDSFAGSGTTGAVAHKMRRRWIMVELGEHCHTHIIPRLQKVIDGTDQGGITEATGWSGGGGFQYYKLAPSLMEQDQWGNWIINREYNKEMLCEALCKIEGYRYAPSDTRYWQHGQGSETDFIYVTTQTLSDAQLNALSEAVGEGRSLLIIASAWRCPNLDKYPNLTLKKIPNSIAKSCEWGRDDYSLNVENLPMSQPTAQAKTRSNSSGNDSPNKNKAKAKPIDQYMDDMFEGDA